MGIGFRELIILLVLFAVACIVIGVVIWIAVGRGRSSSSARGQRPVADRLTELELLRQAGRISSDEYDKQRATIIASV